jgi:N-acetylmuramoyl-L-alanine amidase CwlA
MKIKQQLIKDTPNKFGRRNKKEFITIHETANTEKKANAQAHANLQSRGNSRSAAWHYQVDDKEVIQSFLHDFQLFQSGDGRGNGNLNSISIEICVNSDGDYKKAVQNVAELTKKIMQEENIPIQNVKQHHHWSGKDCPRYLRNGSKGINWNGFLKLLKEDEWTVEEKKRLAELEKEVESLKKLPNWMYDSIVDVFDGIAPHLKKPQDWKRKLKARDVEVNELLGMFFLAYLNEKK